jgi:hypothetical protein
MTGNLPPLIISRLVIKPDPLLYNTLHVVFTYYCSIQFVLDVTKKAFNRDLLP